MSRALWVLYPDPHLGRAAPVGEQGDAGLHGGDMKRRHLLKKLFNIDGFPSLFDERIRQL